MSELLSRLADNYWLAGEYGNLPEIYESCIDLEFERDVDPTLIEEKESHSIASPVLNRWAFEPWIILGAVEEENVREWPFEKNPAVNLKALPFRTDSNGVKWLVLYEYQGSKEKYSDDTTERVREHGLRIEELRFLATVMVKTIEAKAIATGVKSSVASRSMVDSATSGSIDKAFLHEALWRNTWKAEKWVVNDGFDDGAAYAQMVTEYTWEAHLDAALPEGYYIYLPTPWLAKQLKLSPDLSQCGVWVDQNKEKVFQEFRDENYNKVSLLRMDKVNEVLGGECTFLSVFFAERKAWPDGNNQQASWRRSHGACWREGGKMKHLAQKQDGRNSA